MKISSKDQYHALGTLAALDVVFLHEQDTIAREIIVATDQETLIKVAKEEEYYKLEKLLAIVKLMDKPQAN